MPQVKVPLRHLLIVFCFFCCFEEEEEEEHELLAYAGAVTERRSELNLIILADD